MKLRKLFNKPEFIGWLKHTYNLDFKRLRFDFLVIGSPERSLSRLIIENKNNELYLLEQFTKSQYPLKTNIAKTLDFLCLNKQKNILTYIKTNNNEHLSLYDKYCFQLSHFVKGTRLKRPQYLLDSVMGENLADFLIRLSKTSKDINKSITYPKFSLKKYIIQIKKDMEKHDPDCHKKYLPFFNFLSQNFMDIHDDFALSFVHGDFHPLNVVWQESDIKIVIDWEFTGMKPDIYDAANLIGCAGIENPEGLGMKMVMSFIKALRKSGIVHDKSWENFPEYMLALRFAWLSEWLRKRDFEMIQLEAKYMKIIMENTKELKSIWC